MKKLLVFLVVLAMAFPVCAFAEVPNIDNLTREELIELSAAVQAKLSELQDVKPITIPGGSDLIVGQDIPAGTYKLSCLSGTSSVSIYVNGESNDGFAYMESIPVGIQVVLVILAEGAVIRTAVDDLLFTPVTIID